MSHTKIGTVKILIPRVYPLDAYNDFSVTDVCVNPGTYEVYRKDDRYCFLLEGNINERMERLGGGLFALHNGDKPTGLPVKFPTRLMSRYDLDCLIADTSRFVFDIED